MLVSSSGGSNGKWDGLWWDQCRRPLFVLELWVLSKKLIDLFFV